MLMTLPLTLALALGPAAAPLDTAVFAGGCFWGVEAVFEHTRGVRDVASGYAGGRRENPTYEEVTTGGTGHAESVRVIYDPSQVSYATLLRVFFSIAHDATELNRQGPDIGTQYRSAIFYSSHAQKREAEAYIRQLTAARYYPDPIVTEVSALAAFYLAEEYHQDFMARNPRNPYILFHDRPKIEKYRKLMPELFIAKK
jgi:peptide-methionine (S)-S-oxide reductase